MTHKVPVSPLQAHVRRLPGTYYLTTEVARNLDIPIETLHIWQKEPGSLARPSMRVLYRSRWVPLYTEDDVKRVIALRATRIAQRPAMQKGVPGRPRMWNEYELADRNRRNARAVYHRRRGDHLGLCGHTREAAEHLELAESLRRALFEESAARKTVVRTSINFEP